MVAIIMVVIGGVGIYFGYHAFEDDNWKLTKMFVSMTMFFLLIMFIVTLLHIATKKKHRRRK
jgi:hypothetical protein